MSGLEIVSVEFNDFLDKAVKDTQNFRSHKNKVLFNMRTKKFGPFLPLCFKTTPFPEGREGRIKAE